MALKAGIVGLPNVGKSTLFNCLSSAKAQAANFPFCTIDAQMGQITVPDERLNKLAELVHPGRIVPATCDIVDIAGLVKGASKGEGLGNQFLGNIRETDAIIHVLRCFDNDNIVHVDGSVNPVRDKEIIDLELQFKDLETIENRIKRVEKQARVGGDKQAKLDRSLAKYMALIRNSAYANKLEIERGVKGANTTFGGRYVAARYNTIADSLVTVSDAEIKQYYKQHKNLYKQTPYRTISYVEFDVLPTEADKEQIAEQARIATEEFAAAADLKAYVRDNRHASIAQSYVTSTQMTAAEAEALTAGKVYGPELVGNEWRASRVVATRNVADSLTLKHIVLSYTDGELADSLMTAIGRGASFEELASQHSIATETASTGGEIGTIAYSTLAPEFADALNGKRAGETVKVVFGNVIQLMKVVKTGKVQKHYQVASLVYPIEPSQDTKRAIHTEASTFAVAAKGSQKNFDQAAADQNLTPRSANIEDSERMVRGLNGSTLEIVRWANDAKVGDVSELIKIDNNYVVAVLTGVNDEEYKSVEEVTTQIRNTLLRDKKFEQIAAKMQGATIDEIATSVNTKVSEFNGVKLGAYYIPGIGVEPRVLGTITAQQTGTISAPIKGASGVYVVVVDETTTAPELQTAEQEKVKAQAEAEQNVARRLMYAVQEMSDIKDESVKYF